MAMITINGAALPDPAGYSVARADLESGNTARNASGYLLRDRVRAGVYQLDVSWTVSKAEYKRVVDALAPGRLAVRFFDPNSAGYREAEMYAGDRSGSLVSHVDESRPEESVWTLSCSLAEF